MQISSAPTTEPVSSRLSPVEVWQILLKHLLAQHYGLTLNVILTLHLRTAFVS